MNTVSRSAKDSGKTSLQTCSKDLLCGCQVDVLMQTVPGASDSSSSESPVTIGGNVRAITISDDDAADDISISCIFGCMAQ